MKMKEKVEMGKNEIVLLESLDGAVSLPVWFVPVRELEVWR